MASKPDDQKSEKKSAAIVGKIVKSPTRTVTETRRLKQLWLNEYPRFWTIEHTCRAAGIAYQTFVNWRRNDPEFAAAVEEAERMPIATIERGMLRRCADGKADSTLTIFVMKNRMPEKYGERVKHEVEISIQLEMAAQFVSLIRQTVPDTCPHCKTYLGITPKIAKEMEVLSAKLDPDGLKSADSPQPAA